VIVVVPVISVIVHTPMPMPMFISIMNLSQVAVLCHIDLYRRSLWHGLAWRWRSKNDASRDRRCHGQYFDAKHDKILLFFLRTQMP
jgi:hypothetical protein